MRSLLCLGVICALVVGLAAGVSAEPYVAGTVGGAFPFDQSITGENPHNVGITDFDPEDSVIVGARGGFWFDNFPWLGFEGNVHVFFPDIDDQDVVFRGDPTIVGPGGIDTMRIKAEVDVISIGVVALGRFPLGDFIMPYAGGGLALQHVDFSKTRLDGADVRADDDVIPGVQVQGGVKIYVTPELAIFAEYIYTTGTMDTTIGSDPADPNSLQTMEVDFDNQFVQGGVEYRFGDPFAQ